MSYPKFDVQFVRVGQFVRRYRNMFSTPAVRVYDDVIQVDFKTCHILRSFPEGADQMHLFPEDNAIVIRCLFYYEDEKENAK